MAARTPTLIRVKRRLDDESNGVMVLYPKRRKTDSQENVKEEGVKILELAATLPSTDEAIVKETLSKIMQDKKLKDSSHLAELKDRFKKSRKSLSTTTEDRRREKEKERLEDRYRLVNAKREIQLDTSEVNESGEASASKAEAASIFHLYDIVKEKAPAEGESKSKPASKQNDDKFTMNGVEMIREYVGTPREEEDKEEDKYVYDMYFVDWSPEEASLEDFDDSVLDSLVSMQPFNTGLEELVYEDYRRQYRDELQFDDDEDSNDENNERNDYPDEEDYLGYCEEDWDLDLKVSRMRLGRVSDTNYDDDDDAAYRDEDEEDEASRLNLESESDSEEQLLYTRSFREDADMHGFSYAKYKRRILKDLDEFDDDRSRDEDSDLDDLDY